MAGMWFVNKQHQILLHKSEQRNSWCENEKWHHRRTRHV